MSTSEQNRIRLVAVGDVMLGDQPSCFGFGIRSRYDDQGYEGLIRSPQVRETIQSADIAVANFEASYNDTEPMEFSSHCLSVSGSAIPFLRHLGFELFSLANNHSLECGNAALDRLKAGFQAVGALSVGDNGPVWIEVRDCKLAFLGYSMIPDYKNTSAIRAWNEKQLNQVESASKRSTFTVVMVHWGNEFIDCPSPDQIKLGHRLIDAGANIVIGSHPHVLQPVEEYGVGLIAYSLGNFLFDNYFKDACDSAVWTFDIDLRTRKIEYHVLPVVCSPSVSLFCAEPNTLRG